MTFDTLSPLFSYNKYTDYKNSTIGKTEEAESSGLQAFFSYFGGKHRLAKYYPPPRYDTIIEPFAGSAGYSVRYAYKNVILVDKDPSIVNIWKYLIRVSPQEILSLPDLEPGQSTDDLHLEQNAELFVRWHMHMANSYPGKYPSAWCTWSYNVRYMIASQLAYVRHWKAILGDYAKIPNIQATWFIDPPYHRSGATYKHGTKNIDYNKLALWCQTRRGQVIVCEQLGATWLPFRYFKTDYATGAKGRPKFNKEVVWLNDFE